MNLIHLHLLLNHWPIIGSFMALGFFLLALTGKSDDVKQASLAAFSLLALLAIPTYVSGSAAQDLMLLQKAGLPEDLVSMHQGAALLAFLSMEITGALAWLGLWQSRGSSRPAGWTMSAVLVSSIVTVGLMAITGNTGGEIRHPEIQSGEGTPSVVGTLGYNLDMSIQYVVIGWSNKVWPILEDLHFLGLALLLGTTGVLNLRVLGFLKQIPLGPLYRFLPWAIVGLGVNTATGFLFFLGMPYFYVYNGDFQIKIFAVVLAGANLLLHSTDAFRDCERLGSGQDAPPFAKVFAGSSLVLWLTITILGRYLPFFEESLRPFG